MKKVTTIVVAGTVIAFFAGCNSKAESKPLLTKEVFFTAAEKCSAQQPEFIQQFDGRAPSIQYLESNSTRTQPSPTSYCLADALKGHQFDTLTIEIASQEGTIH